MGSVRAAAGFKSERGSVLLLGIAFIGITLLAIAIVTDASSVFRQHRALIAMADGAAIAGTQGIDIAAYYEQGASISTKLDPGRVNALVNAYVSETRANNAAVTLEHISVINEVVSVELSAPINVTFLPQSIAGPMRARGAARLDYRGDTLGP